MQVKVLYFDDCPNWKVARQRLGEALAAAGLAQEVEVSYQTVETPEEAERVGFRGSPTILVDGRDPWAEEGGPGGLSCRIYQTERGPEGSPSVQQLAEALAG
jgi:hypothetical protein